LGTEIKVGETGGSTLFIWNISYSKLKTCLFHLGGWSGGEETQNDSPLYLTSTTESPGTFSPEEIGEEYGLKDNRGCAFHYNRWYSMYYSKTSP
jgi:hypothetical protein